MLRKKTSTLCSWSMEHSSSLPQTIRPDARAYWNVNIQADEWTVECPEYLRGQPEKNVGILSTPDAEFTRSSWEEVKELIGTSRNIVVTALMIRVSPRCDSY